MDLGSVLIGLGTLLVFMVPVYWLQQSGKRNKLKRIKFLREKADAGGAELGEVACWSGNYCLAIDTSGTTLFYSNQNNLEQPFQKIALQDKMRCKVVTDSRTLKNGKETVQVIDRISLHFERKNPGIAPDQIVIFNSDTDPSISDQMVLVGEWQQRISVLLQKKFCRNTMPLAWNIWMDCCKNSNRNGADIFIFGSPSKY